MEQPKMGAAKLLRSKVFWVGDYDYRALCLRAFLFLFIPPTNVVASMHIGSPYTCAVLCSAIATWQCSPKGFQT